MNDDFRSPGTGDMDDPGRDPRLEAALRHLDPGLADPGYWHRFHSAVMTSARDELARRRMTADVTVSELVTSWGRTLVPAALLAAAAAAFLMLRPVGYPGATLPGDGASPGTGAPVALEEMLDAPGLGGGLFTSDAESGLSVTFAVEGF